MEGEFTRKVGFDNLTSCAAELFNSIFRHLKLELLTQFPASNDEKLCLFYKIDISGLGLTLVLLITTIVVFNVFY